MVSIPTLKPHVFSTLLRHHKPSHIPHPRFSTNTQLAPPPPEPPPPPQSLDSKLADTIERIRKLIRKKQSTSVFDTKAPRLYSVFTSQPESLHSMFIDNSKYEKEKEGEEGFVALGEKERSDSYLGFKRMEELAPDLKFLVGFLCNEGYLKRSRMFMPLDELSLRHFLSVYSRGWVRAAAQKFGDANPDVVKCLSMKDLRTLARFGCSSDADRTTVVTKIVRSYLCIDEVPVCRSCKLEKSCKNKNLELRTRAEDLNLGDVMQILTSYALGLVHHRLTVPADVKDSTRKLLNQVVQCIVRASDANDLGQARSLNCRSLQDQRLILKASREHRRRRREVRMALRVDRSQLGRSGTHRQSRWRTHRRSRWRTAGTEKFKRAG